MSPRARALWIAFAAGVCFGAAPAGAQQRPQTIYPYRVEPIGQVLLPDIAPPEPGERTVENGDIVLRGRIGYRTMATVSQPIELVIADQPIRIMPGQLLTENLVTGGASRQVSGGRFFCGALRRPVEPAGTGRIFGGRGSARFLELVQPCFVDRDRDGRLDLAFLAGARLQAELRLVPIAATPYDIRADVPMEGAEVRIVFSGRPVMGPASLALAVSIPDVEWQYVDSIRVRSTDGRMRGLPRDHAVRNDTYPYILTFQSARFEILGYDQEARRVRLRVLEGFSRSDLDVVLIVNARR